MEDTPDSLLKQAPAMAAALLDWYDANARPLPWRVMGGPHPDPYQVWLSEVMLQQTTVQAVGPYFSRFVSRWPTVGALAAADDDAVMAAWAGLGYYARARNLLKCARAVVERHGGEFPDTEDALRTLPGVGAYTAAAVAAIAFGRRAVVVDGNVERVMARLFAVEDPLPAAKLRLTTLADALTPAERCGDYAQAVMDLGATLCSPRKPACGLCPWMAGCLGRRLGIAADLPRKTAKAEKPLRHGVAFWTVRWDGAVLLRKRPPSGLLGGMIEVPSTPWRDSPWPLDEAVKLAPFTLDWHPLSGVVRHTFTHFHLELVVVAAVARGGTVAAGRWVAPENLGEEALPTIMRKIARHAAKTPTTIA
ncbi:MAG: A/G-specific adenine glycosylase [Rhodospirillaceae bacterium]